MQTGKKSAKNHQIGHWNNAKGTLKLSRNEFKFWGNKGTRSTYQKLLRYKSPKIKNLQQQHLKIVNEFAKNCEFDIDKQEFKISKPLFDQMTNKLNKIEGQINKYVSAMKGIGIDVITYYCFLFFYLYNF